MRISDWSSDVCSSDLPPEGIGVGEIAVFAEQVGDDGQPARLDVEQRMIDLDRRAAEQPLFQLMAGRAVCVRVFVEREPCLLLRLARQSQEAHGRDVDRLVAVEGADARQQITESRSEEHTSELQSLMRSTYVVICLHKKHR